MQQGDAVCVSFMRLTRRDLLARFAGLIPLAAVGATLDPAAWVEDVPVEAGVGEEQMVASKDAPITFREISQNRTAAQLSAEMRRTMDKMIHDSLRGI